MATSDFLAFATAGGANVTDQVTYAGSGYVTAGFASGIAQSASVNKAIRQGTFVAAALMGWVISQTAVSAPDDGNLAGAITNIDAAVAAKITTVQGHFKAYAGNPNGNVSGIAAVAGVSPPDLCVNTTNGQLYVCTVTGSAATATWVLGAASGVTSVIAGTGLSGGTITSTGTIALLTASTSVLGGVKVDGTTITIASGVISSANAGGNVVGPSPTVVGDFAAWNNTGGTLLKDVAAATAAQVWAGTDNGSPATALSLKASSAFQTLTDAATVAWNMATQGFNAIVTLGGNRTLGTPTNPVDGRTYTLLVQQPAAGGPCTLTFPAAFKWGTLGAPALSGGANVIDRVYFQYRLADTSFLATFVQGS